MKGCEELDSIRTPCQTVQHTAGLKETSANRKLAETFDCVCTLSSVSKLVLCSPPFIYPRVWEFAKPGQKGGQSDHACQKVGCSRMNLTNFRPSKIDATFPPFSRGLAKRGLTLLAARVNYFRSPSEGLLAGRTTFFLLAFEFGWHFETGWLSVGLERKKKVELEMEASKRAALAASPARPTSCSTRLTI